MDHREPGAMAGLAAADRVTVNRATQRLGRLPFGAILRAVITVIVLGVCASKADLRAVARDIAAVSPASLAFAFGPFLLIPLLGGLRWQIALRAISQRTSVGRLVCLFSVAMTVGQALPSVAGDGFRVWLAVRGGYQLRRVLHSIFLERAFMLLALLLLGVVTQPLLRERLGPAAPRWGAALLLIGGLAGMAALTMGQHFSAWFGRHRFSLALVELSADTRRIVLSRWSAVLAFVSLISNLNFVVAVALLANALHVQASVLDFLAFVPLVTLAATLPISLGGWGMREGAMVALLHTVGVPASNALALSLLTGTFSALAGLPGLVAWAVQWLRYPGARPDPIAAGG